MVLPTINQLLFIPKDGSAVVDLSGDFLTAPIFTDVGSGEVNTAIIVLTSVNGKYITVAPVIDGYDYILLNFSDEDGNTYAKMFEVILGVPVQTKTTGTKLELHLAGIEGNLQKINYIKPWYGADPYSVVADIINYYNVNKGSQQPVINNSPPSAGDVQLPNWTVSNYDFGLNQETCYNRITQVDDKMGGAVASGGVVDFFEVSFDTALTTTVPPRMNIFIKSSGSTPATPVVITNTTSVNVGQTEGGIQAKRATMICAWGEASSGSLPTDYSKYTSQEIMFGLHQTWTSGVTYPKDAFVQLNGTHYQCNNVNGTTSTPPSADWTVVTLGTLWANNNSYSPWTKNLYNWKNSGSDPDNNTTGIAGAGFYDSNIIVQDDKNGAFRTWATKSITTSFSEISTDFLYEKTAGRYYRGLRVRCLSGVPGTDASGIPFANNIAEYNGSAWTVKYQVTIGSTCALLYPGIVSIFTSSGWSDAGSFATNPVDCFHPYNQVNQIPGVTATNNLYYSQNITPTFFLQGKVYAVKITGLTPGQALDGFSLNASSFTVVPLGHPAPDMRIKAYTDSGGSPGTLIGESGDDYFNTGIFQYYFKSPIIVPNNGIIWAAFETTFGNVLLYAQTGQASGTLKSVTHTFGTGPTTFGAATNGTTPFEVGVLVDTPYTANKNSAIRIEYRWDLSSGFSPATQAYYTVGAWANLSIPFPESTINSGGSSDALGALYGGASTGRDAVREPATLDAENMHLTHDGYRGFNRPSAIDFGNIFSLDFFQRLTYQADTSPLLLPGAPSDWGWASPVNIVAANFNMRCILVDQSDNMVSQDYVLPFNGNWSPVRLPISGFVDYRAIKPLSSIADFIIPPKALDVNNVFEWRNIKRIIIQTQDSYDTQGRYNPLLTNCRFTQPDISLTGNVLLTNRRILLDIDGFRFSKALLATTGTVSDRLVQPDFIERPGMILYDNLQNEVNTKLAIDQNRHVEYDMETTGKFNINFGDSLFLYNTRIVPNRLNDGTPVPNSNSSGSGDLRFPNSQMPSDATIKNGRYDFTVQLVAKRIEYSITKPSDSSGGFIRKIVGIKRWV